LLGFEKERFKVDRIPRMFEKKRTHEQSLAVSEHRKPLCTVCQTTCLTSMTETKAPAPRPRARKNDIAAPATSLFSQLTRLIHTTRTASQ